MHSINKKLLVLAFIQIGILLSLFWQSARTERVKQKPLFNFDFSQVDNIETVSPSSKILLHKIDGLWVMPQYNNMPASQKVLEQFISDLSKITVKWPVANSDHALSRFHLTEDTAHNVVHFKKGDHILGTLYKGTSADWRTVHIRMNDSKDIYSIPIETHRFNADLIEWFDSGLLSIRDNITGIQTNNFSMTRKKGQWEISSLLGNRYANKKFIEQWKKTLQNLKAINLVTDISVAEEIILQNPTKKINITTQKSQRTFSIYPYLGGFYINEASNKNVFLISKNTKNKFIEANVHNFTIESRHKSSSNIVKKLTSDSLFSEPVKD